MAASADAVVRAWFQEVWNEGREEAIDRLMAAGALIHGLPGPDGQPVRGPRGFKPFFQTFRSAFPDLRITLERTVTEGEMVAAHCRVTGTHRGQSLGPPTGRSVEFWGMTMARVQNGQIIEGWNAFDFHALYQQLGRAPALPT